MTLPVLVRMWRDAGDMDLPAVDPDEERYVVCRQPTPSPDPRGEEVRGHQHIRVGTNGLLPDRGLLALGDWWNALPLQDVPQGSAAGCEWVLKGLSRQTVSRIFDRCRDAVTAAGEKCRASPCDRARSFVGGRGASQRPAAPRSPHWYRGGPSGCVRVQPLRGCGPGPAILR
jgi:hypothetical protein